MKNVAYLVLASLLVIDAHADTVLEASKRELYRLYPEMLRAETPFYAAYGAEADRLHKEQPRFFENPEWPLLIAKSLVSPPIKARYRVVQALKDAAIVIVGGERCFLAGVNAYDGDQGEMLIYPAGSYGGETVGVGYRKYPAFATSASRALLLLRGN